MFADAVLFCDLHRGRRRAERRGPRRRPSQPGYVVSPYAVQNGPAVSTYYTQTNMTRTIEQILGLPPMNQFDLVASPMRTTFVEGAVPAENFKP